VESNEAVCIETFHVFAVSASARASAVKTAIKSAAVYWPRNETTFTKITIDGVQVNCSDHLNRTLCTYGTSLES
jgi:hypothetical protein